MFAAFAEFSINCIGEKKYIVSSRLTLSLNGDLSSIGILARLGSAIVMEFSASRAERYSCCLGVLLRFPFVAGKILVA
jgi:hypothetical protein